MEIKKLLEKKNKQNQLRGSDYNFSRSLYWFFHENKGEE